MKLKSIIIILSLALATVACGAQKNVSAVADKDQQTNFEANLKKLSKKDDFKITSINPTKFDNVFEVVLDGEQILYTDKKGDYLIPGDIIDMNANQHLSQDTLEKMQAVKDAKAKELVGKLDVTKAIKDVRGKGERVLQIFADPNCHFCKKLEVDIATLDNVTIYTYVVPILGPASQEKTANIVCSTNPIQAWNEWMVKGVEPKKITKDCDANSKEKITYAYDQFMRLGFTGTPAIIFQNGEIARGYLPLAEIEKKLAAAVK